MFRADKAVCGDRLYLGVCEHITTQVAGVEEKVVQKECHANAIMTSEYPGLVRCSEALTMLALLSRRFLRACPVLLHWSSLFGY